MQAFHARYPSEPPLPRAALRIEVLGLRQDLRSRFSTPRGMPAVRMTLFADATESAVDGAAFPVPAGSLVVYPADTPVEYGMRGRTCRHSWLRVGGEEAPALLARYGLPMSEPIPLREPARCLEWLARIHEEMQHPDGADPAVAEALLTGWCGEIRRQGGLRKASACPPAFLRARAFIEARFQQPLRLGEIAGAAHLSRQHLCEGFRKQFGEAPVAYAIRLRLEHARELLRDTDWPVGEVARHSGFRNVYYFSRLHRARYGQTPSAFRAAAREEG